MQNKNYTTIKMKTMLNNSKTILFTISTCLILGNLSAQNQVATPSPAPQAAPQKEAAKPAATNPTMAMPGNNQGPSKEDMEQRKKMAELNKQIQEAEKAGNGATPEITAKKEELKKLQEQLRAKMMAENEKRKKENEANAAKNNETNQKLIQLNKEIKEAELAGKGETPEVVAKKAELKKMQEARMAKMKAEREKAKAAAPADNKQEAKPAPVKEEKKEEPNKK
jgi:chromosome segregation ATPase